MGELLTTIVPAEKFFHSFLNLTSDAIVIVDVNGKVLEVNGRFEELHGWTRQEVVGKILPMTPDGLKEEIFRLYNRIANGEKYCGVETVKLRKDGSSFIANVTISPIKDDENNVIAFIGIERDISEKKEAEREIQERELQFRRLIELNPESIILHREGIIQYVNDVGCKLLGIGNGTEVIGCSIFDVFSREDQNRIQEQINRVIQSDKFSEYIELRLRRTDGTNVDVEVSSVYVHKNIGNPVIQSVIRDLTERKRTEEMIRNSEKLSLIGQLAAGIAHDIRNPLTSLKGFMQLLKAKNIEYTDIMLEEIEHVQSVVNEFMALARPHLKIYKDVDAVPLVQSVIKFLLPQAVLYNVQFRVVSEPSVQKIHCVPDQIKQVLINIIKNAIEAMPYGGLIKISVKSDSNLKVVIRIADQGSGIPEEEIVKLGKPFFTLKDSGTGLGWMISQQIIEDHNGELSITSKVNEGTTVEILLPSKAEY